MLTIDQLVSTLKQQRHRKLNQQQIGQCIDILIKFQYFYHIADTFGRQYILKSLVLKLIEPYSLRKNMSLIDSKHLYILLNGKIDKNGFNNGSDIVIQRDGTVRALSDCLFIRVSLNTNHPKLKHLKQYQIDKVNHLRSYQMKAQYDEDKKYLMNRIQSIQIFSQLPKADFLNLINHSHLKTISKGKPSHQFGKKVSSILYVIEGQIKAFFPFEVQESEQNVNQFLQKYMIKQLKKSKHQISSNYSKGQWIGMEEHEQNINSKSFGIVNSVEAKILYISTSTFDKIFNNASNYSNFNKIKYLRNIKAQLIQKSTKVQQKKESQKLRFSHQNVAISQQLRKKVSKYQFEANQNQNQNPQQNGKKNNKQQQHQKGIVPIKVVHMMKKNLIQNKQEPNDFLELRKRNNLREKTRINLFPEEYDKQFIHQYEQLQIEVAKQRKDMNMMMYLSPKHHRKQCENVKRPFKVQMPFSKQSSFEKSCFQMTRKVSSNFAFSSSFYRNFSNKGDQLKNINQKTINSLQPSRRTLLLRRKSQISQGLERASNASLMLPGIKRKSFKGFQPISPSKQSSINLSLYVMQQKYNIESKATIDLNLQQSYKTLYRDQDSQKQIGRFREYSKTLFVNKQLEDKRQLIKKTKNLSLNKKPAFSSQLKKQSSILNIQ